MENFGDDIAPFLIYISRFFSEVESIDSVILKLHTKKSPHRPRGGEWFSELLSGLIPSEEDVLSIINAFESNANLGICVPRKYLLNRFWWGKNRVKALDLLPNTVTSKELNSLEFAAGSMFWARSNAIMPLVDDMIMQRVIEEKGELGFDGKYSHAIERLFGLLPKLNGYTVASVESVIKWNHAAR
jgi:lipopolysaccharide biosynthesis protein